MMRGQASTEALVIIGFAVVMIFALVYTVFPMLVDFNKYSDSTQAERSLSRLVGAFEAASAYGPGTETTLYLYFPAGQLTYENENGYLVYTMNDGTNIVKKTELKMLVEIKGDNQNSMVFDGGGVRGVTISKGIDSVTVTLLQE